MALLPMGSKVALTAQAQRSLRYPPAADAVLTIVVHPNAVRAPADPHTQAAHLVDGDLRWLGALGEPLLVPVDAAVDPYARAALAPCLGGGERAWEVVWPKLLVADGVRRPLSTVYDGLRPWVVLGQTRAGDLIAAPLNDVTNPKWFTPVVRWDEMDFDGNVKDSQVELAHLWTLPAHVPGIGWFLDDAIDRVEAAVMQYF
ncbi:MAG: hypothetical protein HZB16_17685 [Armatimonadetes bacterium]|nr:hypothetical protein [Armatimonadota bacterium]